MGLFSCSDDNRGVIVKKIEKVAAHHERSPANATNNQPFSSGGSQGGCAEPKTVFDLVEGVRMVGTDNAAG